MSFTTLEILATFGLGHLVRTIVVSIYPIAKFLACPKFIFLLNTQKMVTKLFCGDRISVLTNTKYLILK